MNELATPSQNLFLKSAQKLQADLANFGSSIADNEAYLAVCGYISSIASAVKRVEEHYDPKVAAARKPWADLCTERKEILDTIAQAQALANRLKVNYEEAQERARLAAERQLQAEAQQKLLAEAKEQAAALREAGDKKAAKEVLAEAKQTQIVVTVPSSVPAVSGFVKRKPVWEFEITDPAQINESYLHKVPNEEKIAELVKRLGQGAQALIGKGIKIEKKIPNVSVRGAK